MVVRLMLASAAALGLGGAALLLQPEPPAVRVTPRAEVLAILPHKPAAVPVACVPAPTPHRQADI